MRADAGAAAIVRDEHLFGWATIFVDDSFLCVFAAWFSDFTYWCMTPGLLDQYLAASPLCLDGRSHEAVAADTFQAALRAAFKQLDEWSPMTLPVRVALEWQLAGPP